MTIRSRSKSKDIHTISILVSNKPGVLVRCAQGFARRGFNIESLVVSPGVNPKFSRMTITLQGKPETLEQIIKQTSKLIDVMHCSEHDENALVVECALTKIHFKPQQKNAIKTLVKKYRAKIADETDESLIIEQSGPSEKLDELESQLEKYGIVEMVRSGKLAMARGKEPT